MKITVTTISCLLLINFVALKAQDLRLDLYPGGPDEENGLEESLREDGGYRYVHKPELMIYFADKSISTGQCIVVCPGGGYTNLASTHEGTEVAKWLSGNGITAVVLKYRMPNNHYEIPRKDVLIAMSYVRSKAEEWGFSPDNLGVMGFSAGGHVASTAATHFTSDENRPDFAVLVYPVITMDRNLTHPGSRRNLIGENASDELTNQFSNEKQVRDNTPPMFIVFSDDDKTVDPRNGTLMYNAAKEHNVPAELHIFPDGGHGWGWRETFAYKDAFRQSLLRWLAARKTD